MTITVYGTEQDDDLSDGANDDLIIYGLGGNDFLVGDVGNDLLFGGDGSDEIYGDFNYELGTGADYIEGGKGDDRISGYGGGDIINGGAGNDIIYGDNDRIGFQFPEHTGDDIIYTGRGEDKVYTSLGNDRIFADSTVADGEDLLDGGGGDDIYYISGTAIAFRIADSGGHDRIEISFGYDLNLLLAEIEDLTLTGESKINGGGNALDNVVKGNSGDNWLLGGSGADDLYGNDGNDRLVGGTGYLDLLVGGRGNDSYVVSDFDTLQESANEGEDTVYSTVRWVLGDNFEDLILEGNAAINGFGNAADNHLWGNVARNYLDGGEGFDVLSGSKGKRLLPDR